MCSIRRNSFPGTTQSVCDVKSDQPIIAVLAQAIPNTDDRRSFIAASYVKNIESAGGRVVPIPTSFPPAKVTQIFRYVNGLLMPGGFAKLRTSTYYKNAELIYELAIKEKQEGDYFPIWAICRGFEILTCKVAQDINILSSCEARDVAMPLNFTSEAINSRLFHDMSPSFYKNVEKEEVTYHLHKLGIRSDTFDSNNKLKQFFRVLSTNLDRFGVEFLSTIEARLYPFYCLMWHPEKINYEFKRTRQKNIPRTPNALQLTHYMSTFFVNEARKSKHRFPSSKLEDEYLIYRHSTIRPDETLPELNNLYEQVYIFD